MPYQQNTVDCTPTHTPKPRVDCYGSGKGAYHNNVVDLTTANFPAPSGQTMPVRFGGSNLDLFRPAKVKTNTSTADKKSKETEVQKVDGTKTERDD